MGAAGMRLTGSCPTAPTHLGAPGVPLCAFHPCHDGHPLQEKGGLGVQRPGLIHRHGERAWLTWERRKSSVRDPKEGLNHPQIPPPTCLAQPDLQPLGLEGHRSHRVLLAALSCSRSPGQGQMWPASPGMEEGGPGPRQASPLSPLSGSPSLTSRCPGLARLPNSFEGEKAAAGSEQEGTWLQADTLG